MNSFLERRVIHAFETASATRFADEDATKGCAIPQFLAQFAVVNEGALR